MSPAREIAYRVLMKTAKGGYATDLLRREQADARDLALAESIVLGCLRHQSQLDHLITVFSGKTGKIGGKKKGSFDAVVSVFLFHELPLDVRKQVVSESRRVLKKNGLFHCGDGGRF